MSKKIKPLVFGNSVSYKLVTVVVTKPKGGTRGAFPLNYQMLLLSDVPKSFRIKICFCLKPWENDKEI